MLCVVVGLALLGAAVADITGQNPPNGACLCLSNTGVNVRATACGTVIGSTGTGACYKYKASKQSCVLGGVTYEFFSVEYGSGGWIAGNYLNVGSDSSCSSSGNCAGANIVSRSGWGGRPPTSRTTMSTPVSMVFIHHTVTPSCTTQAACAQQMRNIQNYHMDSQGWADIGYSWLVGEDGNVYEGRGWDTVGAHTSGYNSVAVAVSVIGDFTSRLPNAAALAAVKNIIACGIQQNKVTSGHELFGHRQRGCTACPGNTLYPHIQTWPRWSGRLTGGCKKHLYGKHIYGGQA